MNTDTARKVLAAHDAGASVAAVVPAAFADLDLRAEDVELGERVSLDAGYTSRNDTRGGVVVRRARDGRVVVRTMLRAELYVPLEAIRRHGTPELMVARYHVTAALVAEAREVLAAAEAAELELLVEDGGQLAAPVAGAPVQLDLLAELADAAATLVVVPCSGAKLDRPAAAGELYLGSFHRIARQAAAALADRDGGRVAILSALHGVLELDRVVAPYDVTVGDLAAVTPDVVAGQLAGVARVVALTPGRYTALLEAACQLAGVELVAPLAGSRGIGEQRGRLARIRDGRATVAA